MTRDFLGDPSEPLMRIRDFTSAKVLILLLVGIIAFGNSARAQHDHEHDDEGSDHSHLHFSHPLVAESPSPDTKVRLDHFFGDIGGDEPGSSNVLRLEAEYAFHPSFSVEVNVPYVFLSPDDGASVSRLGNTEVGLKFGNFAFAEHGVLLGYGLEVGLPTGSDGTGIGSDHILEIEPFLNVGYKRDMLEAIGFAAFGIPTNQEEGEEIETEFAYNLSVLYHLSQRVEAVVELDGETVLSGEEDEAIANLSPGFKLKPLAATPLQIGFGVGFPLTTDRAFDVRTVFSLFYHFD